MNALCRIVCALQALSVRLSEITPYIRTYILNHRRDAIKIIGIYLFVVIIILFVFS